MTIPVYQIKIPHYHVRTKPDWESIGKKIDKLIINNFLGKKIAIRCISSREHKGKSMDDLVRIVKKSGTDRYSKRRKGDRYENIENKKIDFFALDYKVKKNSEMLWQFIWSFYVFPIKFGHKPVRLDLAIIYDYNKLKKVYHKYKGRKDVKNDGFVFKDPENKKQALLGMIKIL